MTEAIATGSNVLMHEIDTDLNYATNSNGAVEVEEVLPWMDYFHNGCTGSVHYIDDNDLAHAAQYGPDQYRQLTESEQRSVAGYFVDEFDALRWMPKHQVTETPKASPPHTLSESADVLTHENQTQIEPVALGSMAEIDVQKLSELNVFAEHFLEELVPRGDIEFFEQVVEYVKKLSYDDAKAIFEELNSISSGLNRYEFADQVDPIFREYELPFWFVNSHNLMIITANNAD